MECPLKTTPVAVDEVRKSLQGIQSSTDDFKAEAGAMRKLCGGVLFRPAGARSSFDPTTHGFRRGLHSFAASRLGTEFDDARGREEALRRFAD
jgi:hypothetical protein